MKKIVLSLLLGLLLIGVASAGEEGAINAALQANAGGTYVLPAGEHTVEGQIVVPPNTNFTGVPSSDGKLQSKIILGTSFLLAEQEPIVSINNGCTVSYIDFNGNTERRTAVPYKSGTQKRWGQGYDNFISCKNAQNVRVHNCNFYNSFGDGFRPVNSKNIEFDHNTASKLGHDAFFAIRSEGVSAHDNYIQPRVNSAFRLMDVTHAWIFNNTVRYVKTYDGTPYDAGPDIQIEHDSGSMTDITVCYNTFFDSCGPGLWLIGGSGSEDLSFHHNVFYNAGSNHGINWVGGVVLQGFSNAKFTNNVFDGSYLAALNFISSKSSSVSIDNSILYGGVPSTYDGAGGYGIANSARAPQVTSSSTNFYNNKAGDYTGSVSITGAVHTDPKTNPNPSDFKWNSAANLWECPGLDISKLNISQINSGSSVYDGLPDVTQKDIEKYDFINIFSILDVQYDSNVNLTSEMPRYYKPETTANVTVYDNSYMPQSRYSVKTDNYTTKVEYEYNNTTSTHYLWSHYSASGLSGYDNVDMWDLQGGASRIDNLFVVPGIMTDLQNPVKITVFDTAGHKTVIKDYSIKTYQEDLTDAINPVTYFLVAIIVIILGGIALNLKVMVKRWNFLKR
ncbi:MAG: right-handed parallel beta-helix repeat-containing protein [Candidatus Pacebacteria bacterium]|nr:right-handed parallel beta-helix repeat-containing protein [Fermentimonas sp.]MDD4804218.1 right-handed parallel beta-helix repeat-containing protein [Candidatus Paceibacterota bacterium]